jgi:triacylglycerol lipase
MIFVRFAQRMVRRLKKSFKMLAVFSSGFLLLSSCGTLSKSKTMIPQEPGLNECVILIHGLGRTYHSMKKMQNKLTQAGYHTVNLDYPSRKQTIEELAGNHIPPVIEECAHFNPDKIHFVTHSMGGIMVRMALKQSRPERLGRIVMLSPPNGGSEAVDDLKKRWYFGWVNGPAGQQLSTAEHSVPNRLGPVDYPVGIIAGNEQAFFDIWLLSFFQGANDGKVSVERTKVEGMTDFIVVPQSHSFIMNAEYVQDETIHFLKNGYFSENRETRAEPLDRED